MQKTRLKKKLKNETGITLIALVVTIIVLLILAGVAISMLAGDNGILRQAAKAKEDTERESTLEQIKLAATAAMTNTEHKIRNTGELKTELSRYFGENGYSIDPNVDEEIADKWTVTTANGVSYVIKNNGTVEEVSDETGTIPIVTAPPTEAVTEKTIYKDESSTNTTSKTAVIPQGFKVSSITNEQNIDTGLVVIAPDESQFVWVPVENARTTMYGIDGDGNKLGKLYDFTDANVANNTALNWTETDGIMNWTSSTSSTSYREPAYLTSSSYGDASMYNQGRVTQASLQSEFNEMIESVEANRGFYIGRYETSLREETVDGETTKIAQSRGNVTSTNSYNIGSGRWYGLYQIEKEYSTNNGLDSVVGSSMVWGSQYDQMLIWMQNNEIDVTSRTPTTKEYPEGTSKNKGSTTGNVETDKLNNVYDLLGNRWECTLEAEGTMGRTFRRWYLLCWLRSRYSERSWFI